MRMGDSDSDREKNSVHSSDEDGRVMAEQKGNKSGGGTDGAVGGSDEGVGAIRVLLANRLKLGSDDDQKLPHVLDSIDFEGIVQYIKDGRAKKIITMAGAGISTSAGIPDFRTPGTGLYDNLQKYNLPEPTAVFDIRFFRHNPQPFFLLARELYPGKFSPTPCHFFIRLLQEKGLLLRHYTQNIDTLEREAGISDEKLVEAHGAFNTGHCIDCRKEYSQAWIKERILVEKDEAQVPRCTLAKCGGVVKPDIVFFGENLPERFFQCVSNDFKQCDLLIVLGTSLVVQPFASLIDRVGPTCPRLLINMEEVGVSDRLDVLLNGGGLQLGKGSNYRDAAWLGECDKGVVELAKCVGWHDELENLVKGGKEKEEKQG